MQGNTKNLSSDLFCIENALSHDKPLKIRTSRTKLLSRWEGDISSIGRIFPINCF